MSSKAEVSSEDIASIYALDTVLVSSEIVHKGRKYSVYEMSDENCPPDDNSKWQTIADNFQGENND